MLTRSVYVKLVLFVIITLVGVSYVSAEYVGLFNGLLGAQTCKIKADFSDSGGIFTGAELTYRGVAIGRVGQLHLTQSGVEADLTINNSCGGAKIPATNLTATVSDRSVIGEQYINLIPTTNNKPYVNKHEVIPESRTSIPVSAQVLLTNLDQLANSVPIDKLATVIDQLGQAFNNRGTDLGTLLDSTSNLLQQAIKALPQTTALIKSASTVLQTQLDLKSPLDSFTTSLDELSAQFKASDPDIRHLLNTGPSDLQVIQSFVDDNKTDLGIALADLASTGQVLARHIDGVEEILELYPALVAGGETVIGPDGVAALSLVANNVATPPDCGDPTLGGEGYGGTEVRKPSDLTPIAPNVAAQCTAPASSGKEIRGSKNVPGGDPVFIPTNVAAYPRANTANTVYVGTSLNDSGVLADNSWEAILTDSLN